MSDKDADSDPKSDLTSTANKVASEPIRMDQRCWITLDKDGKVHLSSTYPADPPSEPNPK